MRTLACSEKPSTSQHNSTLLRCGETRLDVVRLHACCGLVEACEKVGFVDGRKSFPTQLL